MEAFLKLLALKTVLWLAHDPAKLPLPKAFPLLEVLQSSQGDLLLSKFILAPERSISGESQRTIKIYSVTECCPETLQGLHYDSFIIPILCCSGGSEWAGSRVSESTGGAILQIRDVPGKSKSFRCITGLSEGLKVRS